jgi:hypothetical protein
VLFAVNGLIKGEIEKPSGQFLSFIMMSHWLGEVCIQIRDISVILPLSLFMWRITIACVMVHRLQVR